MHLPVLYLNLGHLFSRPAALLYPGALFNALLELGLLFTWALSSSFEDSKFVFSR
jgi:hypothetical protein